MSFADRLKEYRKDRGFSQEELAEQLDVSRQAIGKWEQGQSYPELEKLLSLCAVLNVSLDALMADELPPGCHTNTASTSPSESILILAEDSTKLVRCTSVMSSQPYKSRRGPKFALFGVSGHTPFGGTHNNLLGWYTDKASIQKEICAIREAMCRGDSDYTLQYHAKVRRRWGRIEIDR